MFLRVWAAIWCPVMAAYAGYVFTGRVSGGVAGFLAYACLAIFYSMAHQYGRRDYWASKLAMLKAETEVLNEGIAIAYRQRAAGTPPEDNQAITDAYRARLALLNVSIKALRTGYASEKTAGFGGHVSERRAGLLADTA